MKTQLFEALEGRRLLATFTVDTLVDEFDGNVAPGDLALREAIHLANLEPGADVVLFDPALTGGVVDMRFLGEIAITDDLTIGSPDGAHPFIRLDAHGTSRHFNVNDGDDASLLDVTIHRLALLNGAGTNQAGGSIISSENLTLVETEVINARTTGENGGGALYQRVADATLRLVRSTVTDADGHDGGAIFVFESALVLDSSSIHGNSARSSGGGLYLSGGSTATIDQSTIADNVAQGDGGGILSAGSPSILVRGSTIAHNVADVTGATDGLGGGVLALFDGEVRLESTIVAHNRAFDTPSELLLTGVAEVQADHVLVMDALSAASITHGVDGNLVGVDPMLSASPGLFGGTTVSYALLEGSPAIDAGTNATNATTDQRGTHFARTFGGATDIGATERQTLTLVVDSTTRGDDADLAPGRLSIDEAFRLANGNLGRDRIVLPASTIDAGDTIDLSDDVDLEGESATIVRGSTTGATFAVESNVRASVSTLTVQGGTSSAVTVTGGDLTLDDVTILDLVIAGAEGVVQGDGATLTLREVTIRNNQVASGAPILLDGSGADLERVTIASNVSTTGSGAIHLLDSTILLESSTIEDNTGATTGGLFGDADSNVTIERSLVQRNHSSTDGGGLRVDGRTNIRAASIIDNTADAEGGGIAARGYLTLLNSTISGNEASRGAGLFASMTGDPTVTIANSTIASNHAIGEGGGIRLERSGGAGLGMTINSTIIADNTSDAGATDVSLGAGLLLRAGTSRFNLVGDADAAGGLQALNGNLIGVDPLLGDLAPNASALPSHAIGPDSPALDAGSNPEGLATDQRGFGRLKNGIVDIGAYEASPPSVSLVPFDVVAPGESVTLTVEASDDDGTIDAVRFLIDHDGDGTFDRVGTDTTPDDGFTFEYAIDPGAPFSTRAWRAVAVDDAGFEVVSGASTFAVTYSIRTDGPDTVRGTTDASGTHHVAIVNTSGDVVVFEEGWTARDLTREIGAPKAIDDVILWTDPKDGLVAGAYPASDGLVLLRRGADGTWTFRDLTTELPGAEAPVRSLTQFVSADATGQVVVIAGIAADGDLVAFRQTGAIVGNDWTYAFDDISGDLVAQGMATPDLQSLISYRPSWDAWHLAGLTPAGEIVSVWVAPASFTMWRLDNLSDVTGAQPLAGGLSVILTSWSGINLTGLDDDGHVIVTWWVPSFGGDWNANDLTSDFGGPVLLDGVLTSYYTSWDGMNYAGLNEAGEVTIYWWVPQLAGAWEVSVVTQGQPAASERPDGTLTSHASDEGTLNIFGADDDGDVVRVWWAPDTAWSLENLSETATRA